MIENAKRVNEFDYKKMIDDFELENRHQKILNRIKNKWKSLSVKHSEKVIEFKKQNERMYRMKNMALKKKLKEKDEYLQKNVEMNKRLKNEEKEKKNYLMKQKSENVSQNLEEHLNKQEIERLKLEKTMIHKSKYIFI